MYCMDGLRVPASCVLYCTYLRRRLAPGAIRRAFVLYGRATRTSLLRAVLYCTYLRRRACPRSPSGVPYAPRTVAPQVLAEAQQLAPTLREIFTTHVMCDFR